MEKRQSAQRRHSEISVSPKRLLITALALVIFFLLLTSVVGLAEKYFALRRRISDLKDQQAALTQKQEKLMQTNQYLATDEGAEQNLRAKFSLVKQGEEVIVVTPDSAPPVPPPSKSSMGHFWDSILRGLGIRK